MKKEPKNHKTHYVRFILLVIFTLLVAGRMYAQCADSNPSSSCHTNINFEPSCYDSYATAGDYTDLKSSGLTQVYSVTINGAAADPDITGMTITNILIKTSTCGPLDGPYTAQNFPASSTEGYGISFQNGTGTVKIFVTDPPPGAGIRYALIPVGSHITFVVNAVRKTAPLSVSRRYTFVIVGSSFILGDTHITTVDGVRYDFQAVGEFVALQGEGEDNLQIQTRQTAVATSGPGNDSYSGLTTCVSVNTAIAARVGTHRVSYQPNIDGHPDSSGMQLRVDGKLTQLDENALDLGSGGRVTKSPAGGGEIRIDFPDGTSLTVTPGYWTPYQQWFLNVTVNNTAASKGISGAIAYNDTSHRSRSWLPALPDGSSLGTMPRGLHERFVTLYQTFADAWRVTDATSLFDYAPGTTTATFTNKNWPVENGQSCVVAGQTPKAPMSQAAAEQLAIGITNPILKANAIYDVMLTGDPIFAQIYLRTQKTQSSTTATSVTASADTTKSGEAVTFTATVVRQFSAEKSLAGTIEFTVDGTKLQDANLDANGQATITTTSLAEGQHKIAAKFTPDAGSAAFASSSLDVSHTVIGSGGGGGTAIFHHWWFWLILILLLLILILALRKKKP